MRGASGASTGYQISRSLRFNRADTNTLTRTPAGAGSRTTYSLSFWIKNPFSSGNDNPVWGQFSISRESLAFSGFSYSHNPIVWIPFTGFEYRTTQGFRDDSAWYHVVAVGDSTNATAGDRARLYINGVRVTDFAASPTITQNSQTGQLNTAVLHYIGQQWYGDGGLTGFYLTEMHFIDGQALTPSSFGETNADTGVWQPKRYAGSYGTNGFFLNFSDNSNTTAATLGKDYSGNGNNWTPNGFSVAAGAGNDSLVDVPTSYGVDTGVGGTVRGNYCTWNPLVARWDVNTASIRNGNLDATDTVGDANNPYVFGTLLVNSSKFYWEITVTAIGTSAASFSVGVDSGKTQNGSTFTDFVIYSGDGNKFVGSTSPSAYGATYTTGDVIGVALDKDANTVTFYKNNASQGAISLPTNVPMVAWLSPSSNSGSATANFGQRPFAYTAPSGFKALCTQNLPTPTIGATTATTADKYFGINLWTGNGTSQTLTNSGGFQPDWVWLKSRSSGTNFHNFYDVLRGATKYLFSNTTAAEGTNAQALTAFTSTGFSVANDNDVNQSSSTYVGWQWKANGAGVTNTAGSITSSVSANTTSGFSIVTYTGTGSAGATVGHGLGVVPSMIIFKKRSGTSDWQTYHTSLGNANSVYLNLTNASASSPGMLNSTTPTSTLITLGTSTDTNPSTGTMVAYCFAPIAGFSAFGQYTGNGSSDGAFVYTGFRPAYVMIKRTTSGYDWWILDVARGTINAVKGRLYANAADAESTTYPYLDFLSNGFKLRDADGGLNANGEPYIYMCFASNPFKYSLAR